MPESTTFSFEVPPVPHQKIDQSHLPTATEIFARFPHPLIVVLDFVLKAYSADQPEFLYDYQHRFLGSRHQNYDPNDPKTLLNIDHHHDLAGTHPHFSTTPQVISAIDEGILVPGSEKQLTIVNHDDTDSILALLLTTHPDVPQPIKEIFAEAAISADHTGVHNELVNIIDAFYRTFDLPNLIPLINAFLNHQELVFPTPESAQKYQEYQELPGMINEFLDQVLAHEPSPYGSGIYDPASKILHLKPHNDRINTIRVLPIVEERELPVSIIMTSSIKDPATNWWRMALRSGLALPDGLTLADLANRLQLEQYGYGGRIHAGGSGRHRGEKNITSDEMFELLRRELSNELK